MARVKRGSPAMFRALVRQFHGKPEIPSDTQPIPLIRQPLPEIPISDQRLIEEQTGITQDDLETCLIQIRDRHAQKNTDFLVALAQAEAFAAACLEFGPEFSHKARAPHLTLVFSRWAANRLNEPVGASIFLQALQTVLEFHGGHTVAKTGGRLYVGCRIADSAVAMANQVQHPQDVDRVSEQIRKGLLELLG